MIILKMKQINEIILVATPAVKFYFNTVMHIDYYYF